MKCFYINMDRSTGRRAHMEQQITRQGLEMIRIAAVDGGTLTHETRPALSYRADHKWQMSDGEIGCFMSHQKAWKLIADGDGSHGAVFEDDVLFSKNISQFLTNPDWIPSDLECIKLDLSGVDAFHTRPVPTDMDGYTLTRPVSSLGSTGGYIISRGAAARLLEETKVIGGSVDNQMFAVNDSAYLRLNYRQLHPAICTQSQAQPTDPLLPEDLYLSNIDHGGPWRQKPPIKSLPEKLLREIKRPFRTPASVCSKYAVMWYMRLRHNAALIEIEFDEDKT